MPEFIDHNPSAGADAILAPIRAAMETLHAELVKTGLDSHDVAYVLVAVRVDNPKHMENGVRMVANMPPDRAMELLTFITDGTLRPSELVAKFRVGEPKH